MAIDIRRLRSSAPFWSVRHHHEKRETLAMRQDTLEPPRLSVDRGAMLTAVVDGGYGYCATSDLSVAGLQKALDRATRWAEATRGEQRRRHAGGQPRARAAGRLRAGRARPLRRQRRALRGRGARAARGGELRVGQDGPRGHAGPGDAADP